MKASGEYALLWANGVPFDELVKLIREEIADLASDHSDCVDAGWYTCCTCIATERIRDAL